MDDLALNTKAEADATPEKQVRRWLMEIKLAEKSEKAWREQARKTLDVYRGTKQKANSFNILWANTEVLRPALYNSTPKPDVRRRFRQDDQLGKAVSEVMERGLMYCVDAYDMDNCLQNDVLDALLPGRGQARIRYVPIYKARDGGAESPDPEVAEAKEASHDGEGFEGNNEEVEYEQALCEHVQWDDFLHGPGKTWEEVTWCAFKARMNKDDLIEKFGAEVAKDIQLDDVNDDDLNNKNSLDIKEVFKRAALWEIWDKDSGKVFFINSGYKKSLLYPVGNENGEPPLKLKNFFPCPRPLMLMEDTGNLVPETLFHQYQQQAKELDDVSFRINKIIKACRVRFVHDSTLTELKALMDASDNEGIPAESVRAWMTNGGIDKAIWWMPVEQIAKVLKELYVARDAAKEVIYEITGISDILRGATNPNETLGAQKLKANSSSLRLQRMQREVQRYSRDLIRLLGEVIGEEFSIPTLQKMTGLKFPEAMQKQQAQLQAQALQAQQQPVPPQMQEMIALPSWDEIKAVMSSDMEREYRVDIETDSTIAQSLAQDMEQMKEGMTSVIELFNGLAPAVESKALSIDAAKAMIMAVVRRASMGMEVEDALEKGLQQPQQKPSEQAPPDTAVPVAQIKAQSDAQLAQQEQTGKVQMETAKQQGETARKQMELQHEAALEQQRMAHEQQLKAMELDFNRWKVEQETARAISVQEMSGNTALQQAAMAGDQAAEKEFGGAISPADKPKPKPKPLDVLMERHDKADATQKDIVARLDKQEQTSTKPKRLRVTKRDPATNRILEAETVQ